MWVDKLVASACMHNGAMVQQVVPNLIWIRSSENGLYQSKIYVYELSVKKFLTSIIYLGSRNLWCSIDKYSFQLAPMIDTATRQVIVKYLLQFFSSDKSLQSYFPSQRLCVNLTQSIPSSQRKAFTLHASIIYNKINIIYTLSWMKNFKYYLNKSGTALLMEFRVN